MPKAILKEMGIFKAQLGDQIEVGLGVKGYRLVSDVVSAELISEHINASLATNDAADWLTLSEDKKTGALDVRLTLKTDDDAYIYLTYNGIIKNTPESLERLTNGERLTYKDIPYFY